MRSLEHDTLARMALVWWAARCGSCRGCHEIQVAKNYVADAVAIGVLFHRHFDSLCDTWGKRPKTITYRMEASGEFLPREEGDVADYFLCIFEAKATRADFLGTFGGRANSHANRLEAAGHLHFVVTDKGVCDPGEVPGFWGLLTRRGTGLAMVKPPAYCPQSELAVARVAERMLWGGRTKAGRLVLPHCPACRGPLENQKKGYHATECARWSDIDPARFEYVERGLVESMTKEKA